MKRIKPLVFFPPLALLVAAIMLNFINEDLFLSVAESIYNTVVKTFGWLVQLSALTVLAVCVIIYASPFGRVVLGGPKAKPLLSRWQLFAIILTLNIAIGILFWGPVEPLYYFHEPPVSLDIAPESPEAATFAMSTVLLHWGWTPTVFATLIGLMFAFAYYNMKRPFTLGATMAPILGRHTGGPGGQVIDAICLYALVMGMGGSLMGAMMLLGGGVNHVFGIPGEPSSLTLGLITIGILGIAIMSAILGLKKGILRVARVNTMLLLGFLLFLLFFGPTRFILTFALEGFGNLLDNYFGKLLFTGAISQDPWPQKWTQMHFANWVAWAPVMGLFLGRIAYGHSVRTFLVFNILLPGFFTMLWMAIFTGTTIHMEMFENVELFSVLEKNGVEGVLYAVMEHFPLIRLIIPLFLITAFISFISTADSNISAMSGISSTGISPTSPDPSMSIKIAWGVTIGTIAWIMATSFRLEGIRMLSILGGLPALLLLLGVLYAAFKVLSNPHKYDQFKEGYNERGHPEIVSRDKDNK